MIPPRLLHSDVTALRSVTNNLILTDYTVIVDAERTGERNLNEASVRQCRLGVGAEHLTESRHLWLESKIGYTEGKAHTHSCFRKKKNENLSEWNETTGLTQ